VIERLKRKIKRLDLKRKLKFFWQRKTRGFSDRETWSLYTEIAKFTLPRLKRFKEVNCGFPHNYTEETWNKVLDDMIFAINYAANHDDMDETLLKKKDYQRIRRGLNLFGKYFLDLWW